MQSTVTIDPATKPNEFRYNKPTLIRLLQYAINELEVKQPVKVLDVRVGNSGATIIFVPKGE